MLAWQGVHHPPCWVCTVLLHCPNLALILYVAQSDVNELTGSYSSKYSPKYRRNEFFRFRR